MTKTLYVPDHYVKSESKKQTSEPDITNYDKLPEPTGWRVLILPFKGKKKTQGGLHLPDEVVDREGLATVCGYVLKLGPIAYKDPDKFGIAPWCQQGDWVIFGRYAGSRFKIEGGEVRLLNDDEILAKISNPEDILHT